MPKHFGYADIVGLSRPISAREPMPLADRAAQFSPFAALTGHEDAIHEMARMVEERADQEYDEEISFVDVTTSGHHDEEADI